MQKTATLVQEISAASSEQDAGADQINRAIQQLDHVTQKNTAMAEELAATTEKLTSQAAMLQQTAALFKTDGVARQNQDQHVAIAAEGSSGIGIDGMLARREAPDISHRNKKLDRYAKAPEVLSTRGDDRDAEFERH